MIAIDRKFGNPKPDKGAVSLTFMLTVTTGDYLELGMKNYDAANNITISHMTFGFMSPPTVESVDIPAY